MTLNELFTNIANAIRRKKGTTEKIVPTNFESEIENIETGTDTTDATATSSDITLGATAYVKGEKVIGTNELSRLQAEGGISYNGGLYVNETLQGLIELNAPNKINVMVPNVEVRVEYGGKVKSPNLEPQNIAKDVNILGVVGTFEGGSSGSDSVAYYKENRNKNYPYFPLPSEMKETQDTIYMLYGASGYMCCPVFNITFTECVVTVQKYMNTELVSEYTLSDVVSGTTYYMQFSEEDSDYSTYNYIVIKLQGNITKHYLNYKPKFNGVEYNQNSSGELIEVSGNCVGCDIKVVNNGVYKYHQNLKYYSFLGVLTTNMESMFGNCSSLQTIPQLDTSSVTKMKNMFYDCSSLQTIPQLDTNKVTSMNMMFSGCRSLQAIPLLDTSSVTNMSYMFSNCYSLQAIPQLDINKVTSMTNTFSNCNILCKLDITNIKVTFSLSNSTMLTATELVKILNNLATVTTTKTLTLGSTLLAKLTEEEKAIAQNKNWTLA